MNSALSATAYTSAPDVTTLASPLALVINKEELAGRAFATHDVLAHDTLARRERYAHLLRAERLGNAFQGKVTLVVHLHGEETPRAVTTTVWAADEEYVSLKGGVTVPVRAISRVTLA